MAKKRALVLSGGGAKGAFQFGAIKYVEENIKKQDSGFDYSLIAGVSVGALNAVMLAMGKYALLQNIWENISNDQVYKGKLNWLAAVRVLFGAKSVLSNKPLWRKLNEIVFLKDVQQSYDLRIGAVSLVDAEYRAFRPSEFDNDEEFRKAVLASTAIPIAWEPVKDIRLKDDSHVREVVDGGVRNVSPLGDVIDEDPDEVVIINCSGMKLPMESAPRVSRNIFKIATRALADIAIDEIFNGDIREFLRINDLVTQAKACGCTLRKPDGTAYKEFTTVLIGPDSDLGDTLDFSSDVIRMRIEKGYQAAEMAFQGYDPAM
jgi:NTE family protein